MSNTVYERGIAARRIGDVHSPPVPPVQPPPPTTGQTTYVVMATTVPAQRQTFTDLGAALAFAQQILSSAAMAPPPASGSSYRRPVTVAIEELVAGSHPGVTTPPRQIQ